MGDEVKLVMRTFNFPEGVVIVTGSDDEGWYWRAVCDGQREDCPESYVNVMAARANGMLQLQAMAREGDDG
jgi:hypothetical protein